MLKLGFAKRSSVMKHQVLNLRCVLAGVVLAGAGAGTAFAQSANDPSATPCEEPNANCPQQHAQTQTAPAPAPAPTYAAPVEEPRHVAEESYEKRLGLGISAGGGVSDWFSQ